MGNHPRCTWNIRELFLKAVLAVALMGTMYAPLWSHPQKAQSPSAQSPTPDWQAAAGGKMAFDVASVKQNTTAPSPSTVNSNVPMGPGDYYSPTGGLFTATNIALFSYITFAYKLMANQAQILRAEVPKWVLSDRFDIQARAEGNPTKDQMRLMMQSLLADRFKLVIHTETRQLPVLALVQLKPGKIGPQIQAHLNDTACSSLPDSSLVSGSTPATAAGGFPITCGGIQPMRPSVPGHMRMGARNVTMALIASTLPVSNVLDRPVLDRTGLSGTFDFVLEWTPQTNDLVPPGLTVQPDEGGPTFLEALQDQLGLKLVSQTGPVDVFVVDHIEQPLQN
jgi:uncharacterized protein (TIGR03435 family)